MTRMQFHEPSPEHFELAARATLDRLPEEFREHLRPVVLRVEEFATEEQLAGVGITNRWELTGLYEGIPLTEQSSWSSGDLPPAISLFRQPLLREMRETGVEFEALVRHVVIHEAGHHFGFSDDDMHRLEDSVAD